MLPRDTAGTPLKRGRGEQPASRRTAGHARRPPVVAPGVVVRGAMGGLPGRGRSWGPGDPTGGPVDEVFSRVRRAVPALLVERLEAAHPGDDDHVYGRPVGHGSCPARYPPGRSAAVLPRSRRPGADLGRHRGGRRVAAFGRHAGSPGRDRGRMAPPGHADTAARRQAGCALHDAGSPVQRSASLKGGGRTSPRNRHSEPPTGRHSRSARVYAVVPGTGLEPVRPRGAARFKLAVSAFHHPGRP